MRNGICPLLSSPLVSGKSSRKLWHEFAEIHSLRTACVNRHGDARRSRRRSGNEEEKTLPAMTSPPGCETAWNGVYWEDQSWWALSHSTPVGRGLRNAYFAKHGLASPSARKVSRSKDQGHRPGGRTTPNPRRPRPRLRACILRRRLGRAACMGARNTFSE